MGYERQSNQDRGQSGHCYGDTCLPSTIRQRVSSHCWVNIAPQRDWTVTGTREQPHHGPCCLLSVRPSFSCLSKFLLSPSSTLLPSSPCPHFILFFSCCPLLSCVSFHHLCAHTCVQVDMHICLCAYRGQGQYLVSSSMMLYLMCWDHGYHWTWSSSIALVWLVTKLSLSYSVLGLQKCTPAPRFTHECWGPELRCSTWTAGTFPSEPSPLPVSVFCKF